MQVSLKSRLQILFIALLSLSLASCGLFNKSNDRTAESQWQELMTRNTQLRGVSSQAATQGKLSKADFEESIKRSDEIRGHLDSAQKQSGFSKFAAVNAAHSKLAELEAFLKSKGVQVPPSKSPAVGASKSSQPATKKEK